MEHVDQLDLTSTTKKTLTEDAAKAADKMKEAPGKVAAKAKETVHNTKKEASTAIPPPPPAKPISESVGDLANEAKGLKHLDFIADAATAASSTAGSVYSSVRPMVPTVVNPVLTQVEDTVTAYGAPLVATASDAAGSLLAQADEKVDYVLQVSNSVMVKSKETLHAGTDRLMHKTLEENLKDAQSVAQQTLMFLQGVSMWFVDKVGISKNVNVAKAKLSEAMKLADRATDPDVAIGILAEVWVTISSIPFVQAILSTAEPVTNYGQSRFFKAHDTLVSSSYYKSAVDLGTSTLNWATSTTPYKLSSKYLYPWVRPVAQPAIGKLSGSKQIESAINYWKPASSV